MEINTNKTLIKLLIFFCFLFLSITTFYEAVFTNTYYTLILWASFGMGASIILFFKEWYRK